MARKYKEKAIEWCAQCWVDNERSLSVGRIGPKGRTPVCEVHRKQFVCDPSGERELFAIWDAMPEYAEGPDALRHFENILRKACFVPCPPKS